MNEEYIFKKLSEMYGVSEELIEMIDPIFGDDLGFQETEFTMVIIVNFLNYVN